ncbi:hypothetical protein HAX54_046273 [Datura stramonium]|uniref:Uncharacterized protein n=1 Tax=Datura stramonium TaxID=4076 RepID=A0ABS8WKF1_DATST|nr:hypothetical protein [Datura stramonium]
MLRDLSGEKLTGAGIGELLLEGKIFGASDGAIEIEGMVEDGGGVAAVAGVSAITVGDGVSAGEEVVVGGVAAVEYAGEADGLVLGDSGTGDDAGVMTGVSNPGLGVIAGGTGAATVDDGVVAGEFIGETNGVDAETVVDPLGDIAGVLTGVSGVVVDGTGALLLEDGVSAGKMEVVGGVLAGGFTGETNGLLLGDAVIAGEVSGGAGDLSGDA